MLNYLTNQKLFWHNKQKYRERFVVNVFVKSAKYIGDFKFDIEFNYGRKIVDIRRLKELDKRYDFVINEKIISNMKKEGPSLSYQDYDIAPELLYKAAIN